MANVHLATAFKQQTNLAFHAEVGMEGFSTLTSFLTDFAGRWQKNIHGLVRNLTVDKASPLPTLGKLTKALDKVDDKTLGPVTVYKPIGFSDYMLPYAAFLNSLMTELTSIEERLYQPLMGYLNRLMSEPGSHDTIWVDKNLTFIDAEERIKTFASFFDPKVERKHDADKAPFSKLYTGKKQFLKTAELVKQCDETIKSLDLKKFKAAEMKLYETVNQYIKVAEKHPETISTNRQALTQLAETVRACATETELLASTIYSYQVFITAYQDSIDKLTSNLN